MNPLIYMTGRVLLSFMFILAGLQKIGGYAGTQQYMESMGVPGALLPLVILLEVGGGLSVLLGFLTRFAAIALALFCVASAFLFHTDFSNQVQTIMFMKNLTIAGGFLMLCIAGPGPWSLDTRFRKRGA